MCVDMSCGRGGNMAGEFPVEVLERGKGPTDVIKSKIVSPVSVHVSG